MKIALYQMHVIPGKPDENIEKVSQWLDSLATDIDIAVLPEMWNTSYRLNELENIADVDGEVIIPFLKNKAKEDKKHIIAGSIDYKKIEEIYKRELIIYKEGKLIYKYVKSHLLSMYKYNHYIKS